MMISSMIPLDHVVCSYDIVMYAVLYIVSVLSQMRVS